MISIPIERNGSELRHASLQLSNPQGGAQLGAWHVGLLLGLKRDDADLPEQGYIAPQGYGYHLAEGESFDLPISEELQRSG